MTTPKTAQNRVTQAGTSVLQSGRRGIIAARQASLPEAMVPPTRKRLSDHPGEAVGHSYSATTAVIARARIGADAAIFSIIPFFSPS